MNLDAATGRLTALDLQSFALRPALIGDLDLAYAITVDAMHDHVVRAWGAWNEDEQLQKHRDNFTPSTHRIVICGGSTAGFVAVEEEPAHLWLVKLYLLESHRQRGLGSLLLRQIFQEAAALAKPVRLQVLKANNAAQRLYFRHGFTVTGEKSDRLFLVRFEPDGGLVRA